MDCYATNNLSPYKSEEILDMSCGKEILGQPPLEGQFCDDGVRVGERCDADTQCPLTKDSPAKKHDKTATHGKCKTVKNRNIGCNNAVQKSCASLGLDTIAAAAI